MICNLGVVGSNPTRGSKQLNKGSYQSGQMGLTVTQLAFAFGGSNPSLPTKRPERFFLSGLFALYPFHRPHNLCSQTRLSEVSDWPEASPANPPIVYKKVTGYYKQTSSATTEIYMIISTQEPGPQMAKKKKSPVILNYRAFPFSSGPDGTLTYTIKKSHKIAIYW